MAKFGGVRLISSDLMGVLNSTSPANLRSTNSSRVSGFDIIQQIGLNFHVAQKMNPPKLAVRKVFFMYNSTNVVFDEEIDPINGLIGDPVHLEDFDKVVSSADVKFQFGSKIDSFHFSFIPNIMLELLTELTSEIIVSGSLLGPGYVVNDDSGNFDNQSYFTLKLESEVISAQDVEGVPNGFVAPPCPPWWDPLMSNAMMLNVLSFMLTNAVRTQNFLTRFAYWILPSAVHPALNNIFMSQANQKTLQARNLNRINNAWRDFIRRTQTDGYRIVPEDVGVNDPDVSIPSVGPINPINPVDPNISNPPVGPVGPVS